MPVVIGATPCNCIGRIISINDPHFTSILWVISCEWVHGCAACVRWWGAKLTILKVVHLHQNIRRKAGHIVLYTWNPYFHLTFFYIDELNNLMQFTLERVFHARYHTKYLPIYFDPNLELSLLLGIRQCSILIERLLQGDRLKRIS